MIITDLYGYETHLSEEDIQSYVRVKKAIKETALVMTVSFTTTEQALLKLAGEEWQYTYAKIEKRGKDRYEMVPTPDRQLAVIA